MHPGIAAALFALMSLFGAVGCAGEPTSHVGREAAPKQAADEAGGGDAGPVQRRIIHTGYLTVYVEDFDAAREALLGFVESNEGYVARSEITGQSGERRVGNWTVRVPVEHFRDLVEAASGLGVQESYRTDSEDVTEEYIDLEARIKNARIHEESLNELMKNDKRTVEDKTKLSEAIAEVRGEIERMEGRKRYLTELSEMATVHVTFEERKDYRPPSSPSFGDQVGEVFGNSLDALGEFGRGLALVGVAIVPWLPLVLPVVGGIWWLSRRGGKRSFRSAAEVTSVPQGGGGDGA